MTVGSGPQQVVQARLERLAHAVAALEVPQTSVEEAVHDVRVATRRLAAALDLLRPVAQGPAGKGCRRLRALRHGLSKARDAEVALEHLREDSRLEPLHPTSGTELVRARQQLAGRVERARAKGLRRVRREAPEVLERCRAVAVPELLDGPGRDAAVARLQRRAQRCVTRARALAARPSLTRLHAVRLAFKQLRYSLEVAEELGLLRVDAGQLAALRVFQDASGAALDACVAARALHKLGAQDPVEHTLEEYADHRCALLADAVATWVQARTPAADAPWPAQVHVPL